MNPATLAAEFARAVKGEVRFDPYTRALYSTDASSYQIAPIGVVIPRDKDDVRATLEVAARLNLPVLARGGGSSLAGQATGHAVIIDFSKHLRRILEINAEEGWIKAEPGVVCDAVNHALKPHGLMFGTEPASSNRATVGGMMANNSTGAHSVLYGMTADHVLEVEAFLDDATPLHLGPLSPNALQAKLALATREGALYRGVTGLVQRHADTIRERYPKTWRRASGYSLNYLTPSTNAESPTPTYGFVASQPAGWYSDHRYPLVSEFNLAKLLVSSEGTLAVATAIKLNCVPRPKVTGLCVVHFNSIAEAADATPPILECQPSAVELIDALMINLTRAIPAYARQLTFIQDNPGAILVVEFFGDTEREVVAKIEKLEAYLKKQRLGTAFVRALSAAEQSDVWGVRKVGLGIIQSMRGEAKPLSFMEDVAVPVNRLGEYVRAVEKLFAEHGVNSAYYAHASAGCLHIRPVVSLKQAAGLQTMKTIGAAVLEVVIAMGGAMSGEHGDGLSRSVWNGKLFGPALYAAFGEVKALFDPHRRLNPGKIVDAQDLTENLRARLDDKPLQLKTHLDFSKEGGFFAAIEQCNGAGVCRKADGTMCPSYMATRDEEHLTRGRANALRAAMSGRLPPEQLTAPRMHAVMDLCLECKACKAECPSGVDLAKIKYEFLAQYQAVNGVPLRSRLFANINWLSRLVQPFAPFANLALRLPPVRALNEKVLGITHERVLPEFATRTFREWFSRRQSRFAYAEGGRQASDINHQLPIANCPSPVILFVDTFTNYNHPEIGIAVARVLEAAGYAVQLADHGCCGRPMISKGLLDDAKRAAEGNARVLAAYAERGLPIIGLEPSCLLTLRDEYLDLLPHDPSAKTLASNVFLIEEFIAANVERFKPLFQPPTAHPPNPILFHGHCYQKALTGTRDLFTMLGLTGAAVKEIDSGCCGMAGSFGYEAEHYEISQAIANDRLFPAIRAADRKTTLAASGMSCRHQIEGGTGKRAKHPIEVLAERMKRD
jgi:FAD/FMN-containing dehydrogenase/Fe-S oxidoreductase